MAGDYVFGLTVTDNDSATSSQDTVSITVNPEPTAFQCSNGTDDDLDGNTDFPSDLGCTDANDDDEIGPIVTPPRGGGSSRRPPVSEPPVSEGLVLGAAIGTDTCSAYPYLGSYIKAGANNNKDDVMKLQSFLNEHMGANLPLTGFYGHLSQSAVRKFQVQYTEQILQPWMDAGLAKDNNPSGSVYKTTQRQINILMCPELEATTPVSPLPPLPPLS